MLQQEKPSKIRFTQKSIAAKFRNGHLLEDLACQIAECIVGVNDVELIRIVNHENYWFSLDNRRLGIFRLHEKTGWIRSVPANRIQKPVSEWNRKFDTPSFGSSN